MREQHRLRTHPWSEVDRIFHTMAATPSDINEHLDNLKEICGGLACVEFGVRTMVSTWAMLAARPASLISVDIELPPHDRLYAAQRCAHEIGVPFEFRRASTLDLPMAVCDLLFIDTLHTAAQLDAELALHSPGVQRYIAFHDTETFGTVSEDGTRPGLQVPIRRLLDGQYGGTWTVVRDFRNNNGFTVVERS